MPKVAIGLFHNPALARGVMADIETKGPARSEVRMIAEPIVLGGDESDPGMSTGRTDFEVNLVRDLTLMGVPKEEAQTYREGVRRGGVLLLAQGADEDVDAAAETMNRAGAVHVDELLRSRAAGGSGSHAYEDVGSASIGAPDVQAGRVRYSGGGARVFVW